MYASALNSAISGNKLQKFRSHELNSFLGFIRGTDFSLEQKIEDILKERKQSYVIADIRASQLRVIDQHLIKAEGINAKIANEEFLSSLKYYEVAQLMQHWIDERNRLKIAATRDEPCEEDVALYLDVIQICKKLDKAFMSVEPPLQGGDDHDSVEVENEAQTKAMSEMLFSAKVAEEKSSYKLLKDAAAKCGFDFSLYQKASSTAVTDLKVYGVVIKPPASTTAVDSKDAYLKGILDSMRSCDYLKVTKDEASSSKILSLSNSKDGGHLRYDKFCGPRYVLRQ